ncbi:uncharacterized protein LOC130719376 [Lotus japonicus]|uniref:uncharacterized protein LOC130719376 n=1 Tax=Lotus japonicus TaxID=34305 RepID=UPI002583A86B|nr:uncharacterized protein LOC130719376 [Lotus japonicus]
MTDSYCLVSKMLFAKYNGNVPATASAWWKDLNSQCYGGQHGAWFDTGLLRRLGEGDSVLFWKDVWIGEEPLRDRYDALYCASAQQDNLVRDCGTWVAGEWNWEFNWNRFLSRQEEDLLVNLRIVVSAFSPSRGRADYWAWSNEVSGSYTVKSAYDVLHKQVQPVEGGIFKDLWAVRAPSNALALAWRAILGRIPTRDNLRQRNVLTETSDLSCPFCLHSIESIPHLFFSCNLSWRVWMFMYNWCGVSSVLPQDYAANFMQFLQGYGNQRWRQGAWAIWIAAINVIWYSRNALVFKDEEVNIQKVLDLIQLKSWSWLKAKIKGFSYTLFEWQSHPMLCLEVI